MKKICLAMVRCDGHAYTFGPLLDECHPQFPLPYETMLEFIAVVEAGRRAQKNKRCVYLQEVTE